MTLLGVGRGPPLTPLSGCHRWWPSRDPYCLVGGLLLVSERSGVDLNYTRSKAQEIGSLRRLSQKACMGFRWKRSGSWEMRPFKHEERRHERGTEAILLRPEQQARKGSTSHYCCKPDFATGSSQPVVSCVTGYLALMAVNVLECVNDLLFRIDLTLSQSNVTPLLTHIPEWETRWEFWPEQQREPLLILQACFRLWQP